MSNKSFSKTKHPISKYKCVHTRLPNDLDEREKQNAIPLLQLMVMAALRARMDWADVGFPMQGLYSGRRYQAIVSGLLAGLGIIVLPGDGRIVLCQDAFEARLEWFFAKKSDEQQSIIETFASNSTGMSFEADDKGHIISRAYIGPESGNGTAEGSPSKICSSCFDG